LVIVRHRRDLRSTSWISLVFHYGGGCNFAAGFFRTPSLRVVVVKLWSWQSREAMSQQLKYICTYISLAQVKDIFKDLTSKNIIRSHMISLTALPFAF